MTEAASPRTRLARASLWTVAATGIHLVTGMLASVATARILGAVDFGALSITRATLYTATLVAGTNLSVATSRTVADLRIADPERAGRAIGLLTNAVILLSGIATLLCVAFASPIARQLGSAALANDLMLAAPFIVFASINAIQIGTLNGVGAYDTAGRLTIAEGIISGVLITVAAYASGLAGAALAFGLTAGIASLLGRAAVRAACRERGIAVRHRGVMSELPLVRGLIAPALVFGVTAHPFTWLARTLLARGPEGLAAVGVFSAAYSWGAAVLSVPAQVTRQAMPILTSLLAAREVDQYRRLFRDTVLLAFGIAVAVVLPMSLLAPAIMRAYGPGFASGATVLVLVAISSVLGSVAMALRSALVAAGRFWGQVAQALLWGVTLVATFFFLRSYAAFGLGVAYIVAFAVSLSVQLGMSVVELRRLKSR